MRIRSTSALLSLVMIFFYGASAHGQSARWTDRGYVNVSGWFQPPSSFSNTVRPLDFAEPSEIDNRYQTGGVPGFEADGGIRIWRNLAVGAGVSRFSKETTAAVSAQIPHPFFFNKPQAVSGDAASLTRDETAAHLQARRPFTVRSRKSDSMPARTRATCSVRTSGWASA
jgi:hypothetical protein